ncbi:MAG: hypothetical protein KKH94_04585 [Candidatus Omnitrophica bacterium]|nr:hypothetical protein [Candidatus Omnitrophota bacterium]
MRWCFLKNISVKKCLAICSALVFFIFTLYPYNTFAFDVSVTAGNASIAKDGDTTTVTTDGRAVLEGNTSILANEIVKVVGPNDVLFRDLTGTRTDWLGTLLAEGSVVLVNMHGVYIAEAANIDVSSLIASTLDIQNELFLTNTLSFEKVKGFDAAEILNQAHIDVAQGGYLILLADRVVNQGTLTAYLGSVVLGSGEKMTVSFDERGLVNLVVDKGLAEELKNADGTTKDQIVNSGEVHASGGRIEMTAKLLKTTLSQIVNNEGIIEAARVENNNGVIELVSSGGINLDGTLHATDVNVKAEGTLTLQNGVEIRAERSHLDAPRVELVGEGDQYFWGDMTIHNLYYDVGERDLESTTYPKRLFFEPGRTFTFLDSLHIAGSAGGYNIVTLDSIVKGSLWFIDVVVNDPYLTMIGVGSSVNIGSSILKATPSSNFGNTIGWLLNTVYWTGAVNTLWSNAGNWSGGTPDDQDVVFRIDEGKNRISNMDVADITVDSLDIDDSWQGTINLFGNMTVTNDFNLGDDSTFNETQSFAGDTPYTVTIGGDDNWDGTYNEDVYRVTTADELEGIPGKDLAGQYVLTNDIDASGIVNFIPIGENADEFTGYFEGAGFTISNLTIDRADEQNVGLFGFTDGALIRNVGLTNVDITGGASVGGLVGYLCNGSSIDNSYVSGGTVTGSDEDGENGEYVGGLVGLSYYYTTIDNSYANVTVNGIEYIGGLVGLMYYASSINNSYTTGSVSGSDNVGGLVGYTYYSTIDNAYATGTVDGANSVGGLVGYNYCYSTINKSYATGNVTGTESGVGGLVGFNDDNAEIRDSYAHGTVTGESYVGGLVGYNYNYSSIDNSYATGLVTSDDEDTAGGLVGVDNNSNGVNNSFWDTETTELEYSSGSDDEYGITTAEMKQMYTFIDEDWEPGDVWVNREGVDYPSLYWQHSYWTGLASDENWSTAGNWSGRVVPDDTKIAIFNGEGAENATIDSAVQVDAFWVGENYGDDITQEAGLTIDYDYYQNGGTFDAGEYSIFVGGDWLSNGTFNAGDSTVIFNGTDQRIHTSTTFYNLSKLTGGGNTLTFEAEEEQEVDGLLKLEGTSSTSTLALRSSEEDTQWSLNLQGTQSLKYLDVQDSEGTGLALEATDSVDSLNNTGWTITAPTTTTTTVTPQTQQTIKSNVVPGVVGTTGGGGTGGGGVGGDGGSGSGGGDSGDGGDGGSGGGDSGDVGDGGSGGGDSGDGGDGGSGGGDSGDVGDGGTGGGSGEQGNNNRRGRGRTRRRRHTQGAQGPIYGNNFGNVNKAGHIILHPGGVELVP